jgi:hypothetical protein
LSQAPYGGIPQQSSGSEAFELVIDQRFLAA